MGIGDYIEVRQTFDDQGRQFRRGLRGTVEGLTPVTALVRLPEGGRFEAPLSHLARLVRAEAI